MFGRYILLTGESTAAPAPAARKGLVQIFTGDGKGKTTAAIGTVIRALSHHLNIYVAVFMKNLPSGEWDFLSKLPDIRIERFGCPGFCDPSNLRSEEKEQAQRGLRAASTAINSGVYDIVVLDEINVAVAWKLIDKGELLKVIEGKPTHVELILTGRLADPELVRRADLVTEMLKIKHPFDTGIIARSGIEY